MHFFELGPSWQKALKEEIKKPYLWDLIKFLKRERATNGPIYPPEELIFNAFKMTPFHQVKAVIIGQDPYHGPGQAHGLCFSVPKHVPPPPSLKNIFKELKADLGISEPKTGSLIPWAKQGVFLLNAALTVRQGKPLSHKDRGWEMFTNAVIKALAERETPIVFLLWGKSAREKGEHVLASHHLYLTAPHPSPLSVHRGFFGCRHFSKANAFLQEKGVSPIDWSL